MNNETIHAPSHSTLPAWESSPELRALLAKQKVCPRWLSKLRRAAASLFRKR
jgi:hypothetical protein